MSRVKTRKKWFYAINQLDGNDSLVSSANLTDLTNSSSESIIQCNDQFSLLPKIYAANARSLFPKFDDFTDKLLNHRIDVAHISETWQDLKKPDHNQKIDILENRFGYKWYSFARPKYKDDGSKTGGGGSAILVNQRNFLSAEIKDIIVSPKLELVWVKVIPKKKTEIKVIIICGLYSKPNSKSKTLLNDHIATNYHLLKMKYKDVRFIFLGDFNDHKPDLILQLSPQLRQLVHYPTHSTQVLDLLITDMHVLYHPPFPESALLPDDPVNAAPSDHVGNILVPRSVPGINSRKMYSTISVRPMKQAQIEAIGRILVSEPWDILAPFHSPDDKLDTFTSSLFALIDEVAPVKEVKIASDDPPWMNCRIKTLIRRRNREFDKNRKSEKWKKLEKKVKQMSKSSKLNFAENFGSNLKDTDPRNWMKMMKKLGRASHELENDTWHFENEMKSDQQLTNEIATFFAGISGTFHPLDRALFPNIVQVGSPFVSEVPCFPQEHEVYTLLKSSKKTCSVPHDLPIPLLREFLPELTKPITDIFCSIVSTGQFPARWKMEFVSPHPKVLPPTGYQDLRNLSLTENLSKNFERFLLKGTPSVKGLLHYVCKFIDPNQYALPGASCSHALIKLIDFILLSTDDSNIPTAVVNLLADWSKAFNKCNHNIITRILLTMKVPQWQIRLIMSYLENRKMKLRFRGCVSDPEDMPGGMPQGTLLGVILYILYINPVGFPAEVTLKCSEAIHNYLEVFENIPEVCQSNEPLPGNLKSIKFMDDATLQESINLKTSLTYSPDENGFVLPSEGSLLQHQLDLIKKLSDDREMVLNPDKTNLFIVNFTDNYQFKPLLKIPDLDEPLEVVSETKLLGYWLTLDMKPHKHVEYLLEICYKRLWAISKLKRARVPDQDILKFFFVKIRSVLESNAPVFHSMLTQDDSNDIERVQKIALRVILDDDYVDYTTACATLNIETLETRRRKLSLNFALKCLKNEKFKDLFKLNTVGAHYKIRDVDRFDVPFAKSSRYKKSPKVYLTNLLNEHFRNA